MGRLARGKGRSEWARQAHRTRGGLIISDGEKNISKRIAKAKNLLYCGGGFRTYLMIADGTFRNGSEAASPQILSKTRNLSGKKNVHTREGKMQILNIYS